MARKGISSNLILIILGVLVFALSIYLFVGSRTPSEYVALSTESVDSAGVEWLFYENSALGISFAYPGTFFIQENSGEVSLTYWGPTQIADSEFFDGVSLSFARGAIAEAGSLAAIAERDADVAAQVGIITQPVAETILNGMPAYTFMADTLGTYTNFYLPLGDRDYLRISQMTPDPIGQGFESLAESIVATLKIL